MTIPRICVLFHPLQPAYSFKMNCFKIVQLVGSATTCKPHLSVSGKRSAQLRPLILELRCSSLHMRNNMAQAKRTVHVDPGAPLSMHSTFACHPRSSRGLSTRAVVFAWAEDDTMEVELKIEGMMCGGCTGRVEETIQKMDSVKKVAVNLETKLALVEVKAANQIDALALVPSLIQAIKDLGFEAEPHFS